MKASLLLGLALLALTSGCAVTPCEQVCSAANTCTVTQRPTDVDCPEFCNDVDLQAKRAEAAGVSACRDEWNAHLKCWSSNLKQVCSTEFSDCAESGAAWTTCMNDYCALDSSAQDPSCLEGETTLAPF